MKIGDKVRYTTDPRYSGTVVGQAKLGGGWWVHNPDESSSGQIIAMCKDTPWMTDEVWNAICGRKGRAWHSRERLLTLVEEGTEESVAKSVVTSSQHVAGITPEAIDWDAHRAFFSGGM